MARPLDACRVATITGLRLLLAGLGLTSAPLEAQRGTYQDPSLSFEARTRDLVGRMTLEEKVSQMKDVAPGIPRLGIPEYNWWNEGLHGVARSGLATVFPQAIGIAATWDDSLVFRMATVISDEARAKHHEYARRGSFARYQGLTIWSPNINIFRDPRWGRGQETYGEDPYLAGRLAVPFIRGLQGDDPTFFKTIATVKHFAVHSGPEPERHEFNAVVSERDLRETYLPHFEVGIREAKAYSLMCAYNRLGGLAACASDPLLRDILRGEWGFPGFIVSDCGAIDDIYLRHKLVATAPEAAAMAVKSGTDLDCGRVYPNLVEAVRSGLISEAQIDTSVHRLFLARMRLGMFDSADRVAWARIPHDVVDQPAHRALAREVARKSLVLLKNEGSLLPLRKDLGAIAVIGPNANQWRMLLGNYNGLPADPVTPLRAIREAVSPATRVIYARGSDLADGAPVLEVVPSSVLRTPSGEPGLYAEYFAGREASGEARHVGVDTTIDANWRDGAPRADLDADAFVVRWSGILEPAVTGQYRLGLVGTMNFALHLDDSLVVRSRYARDDEYPDPRLQQGELLQLQAGRRYRVRLEGRETYGEAQLQLVWATPSATLIDEAVQAARDADAVVLFLGLTPNLEGEEMPVQVTGFRGGDRTTIDLPATQQALLERVAAVGKPTVLVLLNGSALAVNWAQAHVPAILEAWYPGQEGGAIADVLFGDYNPAGRLPVTFYRSLEDLPPFEDYAMRGRTYRFFAGSPLYPFGHGLSYTSFGYANARAALDNVAAADTIEVSVDVSNTGSREGEEVVQLYVKSVGSSVPRPLRELRGFKRIALAPGATRSVTFRVPVASLAFWDETLDRWIVESGEVRLLIGASSVDVRAELSVRVRGTT